MSDKEIEEYCASLLTLDGRVRLFPMLVELREHIIYKTPTSKFYECCALEDWERAWYVGDKQNKELIAVTSFFQDFVKKIKTSPEYISKMREEKLNKIL